MAKLRVGIGIILIAVGITIYHSCQLPPAAVIYTVRPSNDGSYFISWLCLLFGAWMLYKPIITTAFEIWHSSKK
jgi:hypothetical protein